MALGLLLFIYTVIGSFVGGPTVFGYLPFGPFKATTSLIFSNSLILIGFALKFWGR